MKIQYEAGSISVIDNNHVIFAIPANERSTIGAFNITSNNDGGIIFTKATGDVLFSSIPIEVTTALELKTALENPGNTIINIIGDISLDDAVNIADVKKITGNGTITPSTDGFVISQNANLTLDSGISLEIAEETLGSLNGTLTLNDGASFTDYSDSEYGWCWTTGGVGKVLTHGDSSTYATIRYVIGEGNFHLSNNGVAQISKFPGNPEIIIIRGDATIEGSFDILDDINLTIGDTEPSNIIIESDIELHVHGTINMHPGSSITGENEYSKIIIYEGSLIVNAISGIPAGTATETKTYFWNIDNWTEEAQ